jgi:hypothetical protein
VINELIEDLTKLDLVGERIPLGRVHNNNKERRPAEVSSVTILSGKETSDKLRRLQREAGSSE